MGPIEGAFQWRPCECEHLSVHQLRPSLNPQKMEKSTIAEVLTNAYVFSDIVYLSMSFFLPVLAFFSIENLHANAGNFSCVPHVILVYMRITCCTCELHAFYMRKHVILPAVRM